MHVWLLISLSLRKDRREAKTVISLQTQALQNHEPEAGGQQKRRRASKASAANQHPEKWLSMERKMDEKIKHLNKALSELELEKKDAYIVVVGKPAAAISWAEVWDSLLGHWLKLEFGLYR